MDAVVVGNITLDILCFPVNEVPRNDSLAFEKVYVGPGGCGSNVAIGLSALGVHTALVGMVGDDRSVNLIESYWDACGLDLRYIKVKPETPTGVSIGLVDTDLEPRFIHTSGANKHLSSHDIDVEEYINIDARWLHIAGYFVLPGLLDESLGEVLNLAKNSGLKISLDVVNSPQMEDPSPLWSCMPNIDYFLCNAREAIKLTNEEDPHLASEELRRRGCGTAIIKLGAGGCYINGEDFKGKILAPDIDPIDTTGAGDAFAAGFICSLLEDDNLESAGKHANESGARITKEFGAIAAWMGEHL